MVLVDQLIMSRKNTKDDDSSSLSSESTCTNSSTSSSSSSSEDFDENELLQILEILILPINSEAQMEIVEWKDVDIIDLLIRLNDHFNVDDSVIRNSFSKIVSFVNVNRKKGLGKRRVNLTKMEDKNLRSLILDGLNEL